MGDNGNTDNKKKYTISAINLQGNEVKLPGYKKDNEIVPDVGTCEECHTPYEHIESIELFSVNQMVYKYKCGKCPPGKCEAKKTLTILRVSEEGEGERISTIDLIKNFM